MKTILRIVAMALGLSELSVMAPCAHAQGGVPLWTNRYDGPGNGPDIATAIALDASGSVLVTGYSDAGGFNYDYTTIKYSSAGVPLWTNSYNGPGNSVDVATAVAVDANGNVFVTGYSPDSGGHTAYATTAYSGAGVPLWTNRYNGPGNGSAATAVAVDGGGNVVVTGHSEASGGFTDYATIKYSGAGAPLWTNRYHGPGNGSDQPNALAVDSNGDVLVTGYSVGGSGFDDYATIKYSGEGVPLWTNRYNGPGNSNAVANAVAVDGSGNVFVTGYSTGNGIYFNDFATIKYSGTGMPLWTNIYSGPPNFDYHGHANALAVDNSGNVFVTGYSYGGVFDTPNYATVAYSSAGVSLWTNRYEGPGNSDDQATAVAVDGSGNVFVTGYSATSFFPYNYDYATIAYSCAGVPLWTQRYNGPANGDDWPMTISCLAVGPDGSVYVTGGSHGDSTAGTAWDYATIKYSSIVPSVHLDFQRLGNQLVLTWTDASFNLQAAPAVTGTFTNVPGAASPYTNFVAGPQQFFRLKMD